MANVFQSQTSDDEHIEWLRRMLATCDRWRRWLIGLCVTLAIAWVCAVVAAGQLLSGLMRLASDPPQPALFGFALGAGIGAIMGVFALHIGQALLGLLFGFRNERLLIRYHDVLRERQQTERE